MIPSKYGQSYPIFGDVSYDLIISKYIMVGLFLEITNKILTNGVGYFPYKPYNDESW